MEPAALHRGQQNPQRDKTGDEGNATSHQRRTPSRHRSAFVRPGEGFAEFQYGCAEDRRNSDKEAEFSRPPASKTAKRGHADRRPTTRDAGKNRQSLHKPDEGGVPPGEPSPAASSTFYELRAGQKHTGCDESPADPGGFSKGSQQGFFETQADRSRDRRRRESQTRDPQCVTRSRAVPFQLAT